MAPGLHSRASRAHEALWPTSWAIHGRIDGAWAPLQGEPRPRGSMAHLLGYSWSHRWRLGSTPGRAAPTRLYGPPLGLFMVASMAPGLHSRASRAHEALWPTSWAIHGRIDGAWAPLQGEPRPRGSMAH